MKVDLNTYREFKESFSKANLDEILLPFFHKYTGINAIYCFGSTPSWNDGDPCYHRGECLTSHEDFLNEFYYFEDYYYDDSEYSIFNKIGWKQNDEDGSLEAPESTQLADITDIKLVEKIIIEKYDTNFLVVVYYNKESDKVEFEHFTYEPSN